MWCEKIHRINKCIESIENEIRQLETGIFDEKLDIVASYPLFDEFIDVSAEVKFHTLPVVLPALDSLHTSKLTAAIQTAKVLPECDTMYSSSTTEVDSSNVRKRSRSSSTALSTNSSEVEQLLDSTGILKFATTSKNAKKLNSADSCDEDVVVPINNKHDFGNDNNQFTPKRSTRASYIVK